MNSRINIIAIWIGLVVLVAFFGIIYEWPIYSLFKHCAVVQGRVSQKLPNEHASVYFIYTVANKIYSSQGKLDRDFNKIQVGDSVTVYYDERKPETCTLDLPEVDLAGAIGGIIAASATIPLVVMAYFRIQILPGRNFLNKIKLTVRQ